MASRLDALSQGFRRRFLSHAELTAQLRAWAEAFPDLARLRSLGTSAEGREVWLLSLGRDLDRPRPAAWIDGNMHAMELAGSSVSLAVAEDVLRLHLEGAAPGLPAGLHGRVRDAVVHVLPRMSPDGAEAVLTTGRYVRSRPHDGRLHKGRPRWIHGDVDGDGQVRLMRRLDPAGDFVESRAAPGLMVPRDVEDEGPFYKLFPEGFIEGWDGHHVPPWHYLADNPDDFNRNFPWSWAPEAEQDGAGDFPGSAPEVRAVLAFTAEHPELFVWMNLHTFGGVFIRPLGHAPDAKMDQGDLAIFRQMEAWAEEHTGYPTVSGFEEFCYSPERPIRGDVSDYAYHQRGCLAVSVELWDFFKRIGLPRKKPFVKSYEQITRQELEAFARWDREENQGRALVPWRKARHPQLGDVEVGGVDGRAGIWNPPPELLDEICRGMSAVFLRCAALLPKLTVSTAAKPLGSGAARLEVTVRNEGYLGSYGLPSGKRLAISEPVVVTCAPVDGRARAVEPPRSELGHLDGWGRGLFGGMQVPPYQASIAAQTERTVSFVVEGGGPVRVRAGSCRTGFVEVDVPLPT